MHLPALNCPPCDPAGDLQLDELEVVAQAFEAPNPASLAECTTLSSVVDLLLKDHRRIDGILRIEEGQRRLIPKLLAIAVCGFTLYGVVATVMLNLARSHSGFWLLGLPAAQWTDATVGNLTLAYAIGMIAANGICLPSFYFYGLLSGIRISMLGVTAHALKGMAAGAVALVGILPIYVAATLNTLIYTDNHALRVMLVSLGLLLPFIAGLWGALSLYRGFIGLADTIPAEFRRDRACLLRRLILAWSGCYTFVTPLVIYTLWQHLSQ
jgi:hypothetical protein